MPGMSDAARKLLVQVVGDTSDLETKLGGLGKTIAGAGIGAAIGVAAQQVVGLGTAFDDVYDGMAVSTGKTGAELEALQQSFRSVVANVPVDFGTAQKAVEGVSVRLGATGQDLDALSSQFANLSRITGTDVTANVNAAADVFNKLGVSADEQGAALDKMFAASQQGGVSFTEMAQKIGDSSAQIDMLGLSVGQAAGLMSTLDKAGVDSGAIMKSVTAFAKDQSKAFDEHGKAMDASAKANDKVKAAQDNLAKVMSNAKSTPEQVAAAHAKLADAQEKQSEATINLEAAEKKLESAKGPMIDSLSQTIAKMKEMGPGAAQNALAFETFGAKAGPQLVQALNSGTLSIEDFTKGLTNVGPGINETAASTDDLQQKFDLMKNKVMLAAEGFAPLGMTLQPIVGMLPMVGGAIGGLVPMLGGIGTVMTGTVLPALAGLASSALAAVPAVLALAAPFLPIILAIGAVIAVVAALKYAWDNNLGGIQEKVAAVVAWIQGAFQGFVSFLQENVDTIKLILLTIITGGLNLVWDAWVTHKDQIIGVLSELGAKIQEAWDNFLSTISMALSNIKTAIDTAWLNYLTTVNDFLQKIWESIRLKWDAFLREIRDKLDAILGAITTAWESMKVAVETALQNIWTAITEKWEAMKQTVSESLERIKTVISDAWERAKQMISDALERIKEEIRARIEFWKDVVVKALQIGQWLWDVVTGAVGRVQDALRDLGQKAISAGIALWEREVNGALKILDWIGDVLDKVVPGLGTKIKQIGSDLIAGIGEGIRSAFGFIESAISALTGLLPDWLKKWLGISSPAKISMFAGVAVAQGFVAGFVDAWHNYVLPTIKRLVSDDLAFQVGRVIKLPGGDLEINPPSSGGTTPAPGMSSGGTNIAPGSSGAVRPPRGGQMGTPAGWGWEMPPSVRAQRTGVIAKPMQTGRGGFIQASKSNYWSLWVQKFGVPEQKSARKMAAALGIPIPKWLEDLWGPAFGGAKIDAKNPDTFAAIFRSPGASAFDAALQGAAQILIQFTEAASEAVTQILSKYKVIPPEEPGAGEPGGVIGGPGSRRIIPPDPPRLPPGGITDPTGAIVLTGPVRIQGTIQIPITVDGKEVAAIQRSGAWNVARTRAAQA